MSLRKTKKKAKKKKANNNKCWQGCRKKKDTFIIGGNGNYTAIIKNNMEVAQKTKN
jgi:hypothetical protein